MCISSLVLVPCRLKRLTISSALLMRYGYSSTPRYMKKHLVDLAVAALNN